jgi:hypothetical protein
MQVLILNYSENLHFSYNVYVILCLRVPAVGIFGTNELVGYIAGEMRQCEI